MTAELKLARARLRKWADPSASGNPTKRMKAIWPNPMLMCSDIKRVLDALDAAEAPQDKPFFGFLSTNAYKQVKP